MNAEEARKITAQNEERKTDIFELIKRAEETIKSACENGRRSTTIYAGFVQNGRPEYPEVLEHFQNLGYTMKLCYGTNVYDIIW